MEQSINLSIKKKEKISIIFLYVKICIGIALIYIVFNNMNLGEYLKVLKTAQLIWILVAILLTLGAMLLGSINIQILLYALGTKISFWKIYRYSTLSWAIGCASPGKLGEFSLVLFLKNIENIGLARYLETRKKNNLH